MTRFFSSRWGIITAGAVIGVLAPLLQKLGNPTNMGICVACFERDIAGRWGYTGRPWCNTSARRSSVLCWGRSSPP